MYPHPFDVSNPHRSPRVINTLRNLGDCRLGQPGTTYLEFPMTNAMRRGPWTGGDPLADRVVAIVDGTVVGQYRNLRYCLSMAHEPRPSGHFAPCT